MVKLYEYRYTVHIRKLAKKKETQPSDTLSAVLSLCPSFGGKAGVGFTARLRPFYDLAAPLDATLASKL